MIKPPEITTQLGAFALLHRPTKSAYVGTCKNLRHRASIWEGHFKRAELLTSEGKEYKLPIADLPLGKSDDWEFIPMPGSGPESARRFLQERGVKIINRTSRKRELVEVEGTTQSLMAHTRDRGLAYPMVYKRIRSGATVREALGIDQPRILYDVREHSIKLMPVKIVGATGGFLTYDEAQLERPELGNIRAKVRRLHKVRPDIIEIGLRELS